MNLCYKPIFAYLDDFFRKYFNFSRFQNNFSNAHRSAHELNYTACHCKESKKKQRNKVSG